MGIEPLINDTVIKLEKITNDIGYTKDEHEDVKSKIHCVRERIMRDVPYVAVIGQFSYGKSSFINTFIGESLLLTKNRPTTQVATFIEYGDEIDCIVYFLNGECYSWMQQQQEISKLLGSEYRIKAPLDVVDIIQLITTDANLIIDIDKVVIKYPSPRLAQGLILIDTPGLQAAGKQKHSQITTKIFTQMIDACIVMLDANQIAPKRYIAMVKDFIQKNPVKLFFVLNKMDAVFNDTEDEQEQLEQVEELVQIAKLKLQKGLNINKPIIYPLSSIEACSFQQPRKDTNPSRAQEIIVDGFNRFTKALTHYVKNEYEMTTAKSAVDILHVSTHKIQDSLQSEIDQLTQLINKLTQHQILKIDAFSKRVETNVFPKFVTHAESVMACTERHMKTTVLQRTLNKIRSMIKKASSKDELKEITSKKLPRFLKKLPDSVVKELNDTDKSEFAIFCAEMPAKLEQDIDKVFENMYHELTILDTSFCGKKSKLTALKPKALKLSVNHIFDQAKAKEDENAWGGVAAGVVVSILIPGIGPFIGGFIGGALGSCFGPSLDQLKADIETEICTSMKNQWENTLVKSVSSSLQSATFELLQYGKQRIIDYALHYRDSVNERIHIKEVELKHLQKRQCQAKDYLGWCRARQEKLESTLMTLQQNSNQAEEKIRQLSVNSLNTATVN